MLILVVGVSENLPGQYVQIENVSKTWNFIEDKIGNIGVIEKKRLKTARLDRVGILNYRPDWSRHFLSSIARFCPVPKGSL